jgi:hypothetical protein
MAFDFRDPVDIWATPNFFLSWLHTALRFAPLLLNLFITYLLSTGTAKAIENLHSFRDGSVLKGVQAATPQDAAYAIVRAGARRQSVTYYPYYGRFAVLAYYICPSLIERLQASLYSN